MSRRRPTLALFALVVALVGCASGPTAGVNENPTEMKTLRARSAYERAATFLREGQPAPALTALQEATALDPTVALYANTLGVVLLQLRQVQPALGWFQRAVQLDPAYGDAQLNQAIALSELGSWQEAVDGYAKALRLPTLTIPHVAHQNLGVALYNLRRYSEAEQALRFAQSLEPQMVGIHYNLGLVFLALNRKPEAVAAFRRERELAPADSTFAQAAVQQLKTLGEGGK